MKTLILTIVALLTTVASLSQEYDIKRVWGVERAFTASTLDSNGLITKPDTLYYETNIVPVAADSVAVIFESSSDSVTVSVQFRPTSPNLIVDPKTPLDSILTNSGSKMVHFSAAKHLATTKQYGKFYIRMINNKKLPSTVKHRFSLWTIRRFK